LYYSVGASYCVYCSLQRRFGTVRRIATAPAAGQGSGALFRPTSGEINNANTPTNQISAERPKTSFSGLIVDPLTTRDDLIFPHQPNCTSGVKTLSGSRYLVDAVAEPHGQARGCALQRSKSSLAVIAPTTDVILATLQRAQVPFSTFDYFMSPSVLTFSLSIVYWCV
jgi:hypothetical protein